MMLSYHGIPHPHSSMLGTMRKHFVFLLGMSQRCFGLWSLLLSDESSQHFSNRLFILCARLHFPPHPRYSMLFKKIASRTGIFRTKVRNSVETFFSTLECGGRGGSRDMQWTSFSMHSPLIKYSFCFVANYCPTTVWLSFLCVAKIMTNVYTYAYTYTYTYKYTYNVNMHIYIYRHIHSIYIYIYIYIYI